MRMKLSVMLQTRSSCCRSWPYVYSFTHKPVVNLKWGQYIRRNS